MKIPIEASGWPRTKSVACCSACEIASPLSLAGFTGPEASEAGVGPGVDASLL